MKDYNSRYIDLLKKVLIDYFYTDSFDYCPIDLIRPNWKTAFLYPINDLLKKRNFGIVKYQFASELARLNGLDWPVRAKTMIGLKRLDNIEYCINTIIEDKIEGDLIETGVWRGGATILMKAILNEHKIMDKTIWLADSFEGLPRPNAKSYKADRGNKLHHYNLLKVSKEEVESNFRKFSLLDEKVKFIKGWFSDTLPVAPVNKLSLLRLDGDLYESTFLALQHLYSKLSVGGFLIVDDFNAFPNCKQAVNDFRDHYDINEEIIKIDTEAVFWRKQKL
jgi:O-methyltransferase